MKKIKFDELNNAIFEYDKDSGETFKEHLLDSFDHEAIMNAKDDKELWEILPTIVIRKSEEDKNA